MSSLLAQYIADVHELDQYLAGKPVTLTGSSLTLPQIAAIALYPPSASPSLRDPDPAVISTPGPTLQLTTSTAVRAKVDASRTVIDTKMAAGLSIYGVSTGFGGSADTRTNDPIALGAALLQHQHAGVILPSSAASRSSLASYTGPLPMPLSDPAHGSTMPVPWTRAAMLIRANSLMRGHSGVRWSLVEKMTECIRKGLVPVVPLRGSISASGDLSPLSYVAGMLIGNPAIRVWVLPPRLPDPVPFVPGPVAARPPPPSRLILEPISRSISSSTDASGTTSPTSPTSSASPRSTPSTPASSVHPDDEDHVKPFSLEKQLLPSPTLTSTAVAVPAPHALRATGTTPLPLASKEHLGIVNGTAFSAGLTALVVRNAESIGVLSAVLTALAVEAMIGARGSFDPFVGEARPHVGQIEAAHLVHTLLAGSRFATDHEEEARIEEDDGILRQDRYSLRTAPQWLGPQFEELKRAKETVCIEVNSTTDNPLIEPPRADADGKSTGTVHHAGNFQALAMTVAMDHVRLAIAQLGRLMFVQLTEIVNPAMNRGLPGNLAGGEAAHDFGCKGLDIAAASYAGELNALGGINVGVGVVSAEMHNQSLNSLALVSARYTLAALEVSELLAASHLFVLCQALDLRALHTEMRSHTRDVVRAVIVDTFPILGMEKDISHKVIPAVLEELDNTTAVPIYARMGRVAGAAVAPLLEALSGLPGASKSFDLSAVSQFREVLARRLEALLVELRCAFMGPGARVEVEDAPAWRFGIARMGRAPASRYLAPRTRLLYEFVRLELSIGMCGADNLAGRVYGMRAQDRAGAAEEWNGLEEAGLGQTVDTTYGDKVAMIVEAIRDGRVGRVMVAMCAGVDE